MNTLANALNYATAAHDDAVEAVARAEAALLAARSVEQDTAVVLSTITLLTEQQVGAS